MSNQAHAKPSICYARRHMSMAASTYYEYALAVSHKSDVFYSHDRRDAEQFGEESVSPTTILSLRSWLEGHGWFVPLDKRSKRKRNPVTGLYLPIRYRVLSHDLWVAAHPGKCRFPKSDTVPPTPDSVAGPAPDSVAGEQPPATDFVTTGTSLPIPPAPESDAKSGGSSLKGSSLKNSSSPESDDELRFLKAKAKFLADATGPKDQIAGALDLIRERVCTNGNQPVRNWNAYLKECLANFLDSDWKTVHDRIARAAKAQALSSPEAKAKAQHLHKTAMDHGWTQSEFDSLLRYDFDQPIRPTVASIAQLSELAYQAALTRFQQPPESICKQCGQRGCEHLRAEHNRSMAELRQRLEKS
jgi:hypothetical protein